MPMPAASFGHPGTHSMKNLNVPREPRVALLAVVVEDRRPEPALVLPPRPASASGQDRLQLADQHRIQRIDL